MSRSFSTLNSKVIKPRFPKCWADITNWLSRSSEEGNIINDEIVSTFLYANPFLLRDYFDDYNIHIAIVPQDGRYVYYNTKDITSYSAPTRREAEEGALMEAFKLRENELNNTK
mgnify:CR=1 FL=1